MAGNPVRIFLDSTVIISGLLSDRGAPRVILDLLTLRLPGLIGLTGAYNLRKIERNIIRKLPRAVPVYNEYLPRLCLEIIPLPAREEIARHLGIIADKDVPVLVSALNGAADFLVTGDMKDFGKLKETGGFTFIILSPAEFLERIGRKLADSQGGT
jgi:predicted nucleic acid-binding protein